INIEALNIHGFHLPAWMTMDYLSASRGFTDAIANNISISSLEGTAKEAYDAWVTAPMFAGIKIIADIPALFITLLISVIIYRGIKESRNSSNVMVLLKLIIIIFVISIGAFYVDTGNWSPFAPNGVKGILQGVSAVFFAYIGFDAISTTAEECKNPQRDLPRAMFYSLAICSVLYIGIALVLTGMVSYKELQVGDPLSFVFQKLHLQKLSLLIGFGAILAMASVFLVFQLGQPRIWMSMSRDGLLPPRFAKINPRFKTPGFATIIAGLLVAIPALFLNLTEVTDLTSIGTLFAFILVCAGVLRLQMLPNPPERKFKTPYINSRYITPLLFILTFI
ncbi:MAG: amino acid permease, partial [Bacteroidia bacterium]|nr:amino acid permease [Bacteroidia bacterium]